MGSVRQIITGLTGDLENFIADTEIVFENYRLEIQDLEERKDFPKGRIALYPDNDTEITRIDANKPMSSVFNIGCDISIRKGYRNDDATNAELVMYDFVDDVIEWVKNVNPHQHTGGFLMSIGFTGSQRPTRNPVFVNITLQLSGYRYLKPKLN